VELSDRDGRKDVAMMREAPGVRLAGTSHDPGPLAALDRAGSSHGAMIRAVPIEAG
jgi:hypothetical protein